MHRDAYQRCRRERLKPWLLVRVWELQKRGVLHAHPVFAYSTLAEKRAADSYIEHLDSLRDGYGFGYIERKRRVSEPRAAAAYLSSYFVAGKRRKLSLRESVQSQWMPHTIIHVSVRLTRSTGITMRTLRLKRYLWVQLSVLLDYLRSDAGLSLPDIYRAHKAGVSMVSLLIFGAACRAP